MGTNKRLNDKWYYGDKMCMLIIFLMCFVPRLLLSLMMVYTTYVADEPSTMSAITLITGYDWSEVISQVGYYGGGMSILLAPLYYIFNDPVLIYHAMLIMMCLLQSLTGIIAFRILKKHFPVDSNMVCMIIAVAANYVVTRRSNNVTNEHMLILLTWLIALVLLELVDNTDSRIGKMIYSVLLGVLTGYAMTVHERGKVYAIALAIIVVLYFWVYRKLLISIVGFTGTYILLYLGAKWFKGLIVARNWSEKSNTVKNTAVSFSGLPRWIRSLFSLSGISSVLGPVTTISVVTGGVILLAFIMMIVFLFKGITRKEEIISPDSEEYVINKKIFVLGLFMFACISMTILSQSITWLPSLQDAFGAKEGNNNYGWKAMTYIRYFGIYVGPVFLMTLYYMINHKKLCLLWLKFVGGIVAVSSLLWLGKIRSLIAMSTNAIEAFLPFSGESKYNLQLGPFFYAIGILVLIVMVVLTYWLIKKEKTTVLFGILCFLMVYQYVYNSFALDKASAAVREAQVRTYEVIKENEVLFEEDDIYVSDTSSSRRFLTYQTLFYDKKIILDLPDANLENGILISKGGEMDYLFEYGWKVLDLNRNEYDYVWIKGEEYQKAVEENGYTLLEYMPVHIELVESDFQSLVLDQEFSEELEDWPETSAITKGYVSLYRGIYSGEIEVDNVTSDETSNIELRIYNKSNELLAKVNLDNCDEMNVYKFQLSLKDDNSTTKIMVCDDKGSELKVKKLNIDKEKDSFRIGADGAESVEEMSAFIKTLNRAPVLCMINQDISVDFEYIESRLEIEKVDEIDLSEAQTSREDNILICSVSDDWMSLLDIYMLVHINEQFVVLTKREGVNGLNSQIKPLDNNGSLSSYVIEEEHDEILIYAKHKKLCEGYYTIEVDVDEETLAGIRDQQSILELTIANSNRVITLPAWLEGNVIKTEVGLNESMNKWKLKAYVDEIETQYTSFRVKKDVSGIQYYYENNIKPVADTIAKLNWNPSIVLYKNKDSISQKLFLNYLELNLPGAKQNVEIKENKYYDFEQKTQDIVIIPCNESNVFKLLSEYDIVMRCDKYVMMVKKDEENIKGIEASGITLLSKDKTIFKNYYLDAEGNSYNVDLPRGTYELLFKVELPSGVVEGQYGEIQVASKSGVITKEEVIMTGEDVERGYFMYTIQTSGMGTTEGIKLIFAGAQFKIAKVLEQVTYLTDRYTFSMDSYEFENAIYDELTDTIKKDGEGKCVIRTKLHSVSADKVYRYHVNYKGDKPKITVKSVNNMNGLAYVNSTSTKCFEKEDGTFESILEVKPSANRTQDNILIEVEDSDNFELTSVEIEIVD